MGNDRAVILEKGRDAHRRKAWDEAYRHLSLADEAEPLSLEDLDRLTWSAGCTGRVEEMLRLLTRLHQTYSEKGEDLWAARAAFWLGMRLFSLNRAGQAAGWLARAQRHVEHAGRDCAEQGYLLIPVIQRNLAGANYKTAQATAETAVAIGERFGEPDLVAFGQCLLGRALLAQGRIPDGLAVLDDSMLSVTGGELSPAVTGIVYCAAIASCQRFYALDRAREWTAALSAWCDSQPELVSFTGSCLVHRSEILQLEGAWDAAIGEARRAVERFRNAIDREAVPEAAYQEGEIQRLRGNFEDAEAAYREASNAGYDPQPGLSLLRVAQGRAGTAVPTMRRMLGATEDRFSRARLLPAHVEILLAAGELAEAADAAAELAEIAAAFDIGVLRASAMHAVGAVKLHQEDAAGAVGPLGEAFAHWQAASAPYLAARVRVLLGQAYQALGDEEGASLAFEAALAVFNDLGAAPDVAAIGSLTRTPVKRDSSRLTGREIEVLRLVAAGKTNKQIARQLELSEKTVDRHVSNILTKLNVPTRAGATAHAYENKLIS